MTETAYAADPSKRFASFSEFYKASAYAPFAQDYRAGGTFGVSMLKTRQDAVDLVNSAVPEFVFGIQLSPIAEAIIDIGDGPARHVQTQRGSLCVVPPDTEARYCLSERHEGSAIAIPSTSMYRLLEQHGLQQSVFARHYGAREYRPLDKLDHTFEQLWQAATTVNSTDSLLFDGCLLQFLATVASSGALSPLGASRPEDARIARVIDYIEAHYSKSLSIAELADVACLSPGHFSRTFKATKGEPVWVYVQRRRCERARDMVLGSRLPLVEIAHRCGFGTQAHMTTQFRKAFGTTPGAARRFSAKED